MEEIKIKHLTKIEGHAKLTVKFDRKNKEVKHCSLNVFESPRYFEEIIKGRNYKDVPYLSGRICGICNVAHLIGSTLAVENALKIEVTEQTKLLRELLVLSGIFHSHTLQLYFLALPDYLGYSSALDMEGKDIEHIKRCLRLKEVGNDIVNTIGGRSIHPITSVIGGFTKLPKQEKLNKLKEKLRKSRKDAEETIRLFESINFPDVNIETEFLALKNGEDYPFLNGNISSLSGTYFKPEEYKKYLKEEVAFHSTSKHVTFEGKSFMVGPLARINIHGNNLSKDAAKFLKNLPKFNLFYANVARSLEIFHCIDRCIEILEKIKIKNEGIKKPEVFNGEGISATEAPRGLLLHHYKIKNGKIIYSNIIPPTTQNVKNMEDSIKKLIPNIMDLDNEKIKLELEKLLRAYDPCFSCSAHFLEIEFI